MTCRETVLEALPPMVAGDRTGVELVIDHAEARGGTDGPLHLRVRGLMEEVEGYGGAVDLEDALGTAVLAVTLEEAERLAQVILRAVALARGLRQESLSWVTGGVA